MTSRHTLHAAQRHAGWDRDLAPAAHVAPGDAVELEVLDAADGQLGPGSPDRALAELDPARANPTTGPVHVEGAEPGDALVVRLEDVALAARPGQERGRAWGWTGLIPGFGLLADEFPEPRLLHWSLDPAGLEPAELPGGGARVWLRPFVGTVGVAPAEPGRHDQIPPRRVGGNLDTRELCPGTTLRLPVAVPGARLSIGDTHAAQGDGEVCGTAIEAPATVAVTVDVEKGRAPPAPAYDTASPPRGEEVADGVVATTGVEPDLMAATRAATRAMIDRLEREAGLEADRAYALCSVAGDLAITEVVDAPNWVVACRLPRRVLG